MKMILKGLSKDKRAEMSLANITFGMHYEIQDSIFQDNNGIDTLVCLYCWEAIESVTPLAGLKEHTANLPDDDRKEPILDDDGDEVQFTSAGEPVYKAGFKASDTQVGGDRLESSIPKLDSLKDLTFSPLLKDQAMRFNKGKAELSYIMSMPNACSGISAAFTMGAEKYDRDNWKKGFDRNSLVDCALRHLMKAQNGEVFDKESGLDHLFHFAWNAMILAEQEGLIKNENNS